MQYEAERLARRAPAELPPLPLAAILIVSHETLAALMQLPEGAYIDGVTAPLDRPGTLHLRVAGAGWPVKPGGFIPNVRGAIVTTKVTMVGDERIEQNVIDWELPHHA